MSYKLKYMALNDAQLTKLKEMNIPNTDNPTDEKQWVENAKKMAESENEQTEKAIGAFLNKDE